MNKEEELDEDGNSLLFTHKLKYTKEEVEEFFIKPLFNVNSLEKEFKKVFGDSFIIDKK